MTQTVDTSGQIRMTLFSRDPLNRLSGKKNRTFSTRTFANLHKVHLSHLKRVKFEHNLPWHRTLNLVIKMMEV